jgi:anthranilate phosphoribosyltransferase
MSVTFPNAYAELLRGRPSADTISAVFDALLAGAWTPIQIAGFVTALGVRGEDPTTIAAAARSMRRAMIRVEHGLPRVLDTCGTGGDGAGSLNISTGAAIIAAAAGAVVAKHGNRAISSRSGAADVLEALRIPVDLPAGAGATLLQDLGIAFLMAPTHHPAMRHAAAARKELGVRTIFNCLGPLANPALATHQLLGSFSDELRPILAATLTTLGTQRAWVVRGEDGLDEVSISGATRVSEVSEGRVTEKVVHPEDFGIARAPAEAIRGGSAEENARALEAILSGEPHPGRDAVVLNAAAALVVYDDLSPTEATERALDAIRSGAAHAKLEAWRGASSALRGSA